MAKNGGIQEVPVPEPEPEKAVLDNA